MPLALTADDDSYVIGFNETLTAGREFAEWSRPGVLDGDTGQGLTAVLVTPPAHGTVVSLDSHSEYSEEDGRLVYTPTLGFVGTDTFTYRGFDGSQYSNTATVTITVLPPTFNTVATLTRADGRSWLLVEEQSNGALYRQDIVDNGPSGELFQLAPAFYTFGPPGDALYSYNFHSDYSDNLASHYLGIDDLVTTPGGDLYVGTTGKGVNGGWDRFYATAVVRVNPEGTATLYGSTISRDNDKLAQDLYVKPDGSFVQVLYVGFDYGDDFPEFRPENLYIDRRWVTSSLYDSFSNLKIEMLSNGELVATWSENVFNEDGSYYLGTYVDGLGRHAVNTEEGPNPEGHTGLLVGAEGTPEFTVLEDGRILVSWTKAAGGSFGQLTGPDGKLLDAQVRLLTPGADLITGGSEDTHVLANPTDLGATDKVTGGLGLDTLEVSGSGTLDLTHPVGGFERLLGSVGNDTVVLSAGFLNGLKSINTGGGTDTLTTTGAVLDLTGVTLEGVEAVTTSRSQGTTFKVANTDQAFRVRGGAGQDMLELTALTLTSAQRYSIFPKSVEVIHDAKGYWGDGSANRITGTGANDWIQSGEGNDILSGGNGDDQLYGEGGDDQISGGEGNDNLSGRGGLDRLNGDGGDDQLFGGDGNDILNGGLGADRLNGDGGDDQLYGGDAKDILNGGIGIDRLNGDAGDDQLLGGDGNDILNGAAGLDRLNGEAGDDQLFGGDNNDILNGGLGADRLNGDAGDDQLFGGDGKDVLSGGTGADRLNGEAGADNLSGGDDSDVLNGGPGNDVLTGGLGLDVFLFNTALSSTLNSDNVKDFLVVDDTIQLENAVFTAFTSTGVLPAGAFVIGTAAQDASDRIIYNSASGVLLYDADGNGVTAEAIKFAQLTAGLALTNSDFLIV